MVIIEVDRRKQGWIRARLSRPGFEVDSGRAGSSKLRCVYESGLVQCSNTPTTSTM